MKGMHFASLILAYVCVLATGQHHRRHLPRSLRGADVTFPVNYGPHGQCALGILMIDGYYYPTQPGDVDDLRTWCTVLGPDPPLYRCSDEDSSGLDLVKSVVKR